LLVDAESPEDTMVNENRRKVFGAKKKMDMGSDEKGEREEKR
jgi:hypothetical protein